MQFWKLQGPFRNSWDIMGLFFSDGEVGVRGCSWISSACIALRRLQYWSMSSIKAQINLLLFCNSVCSELIRVIYSDDKRQREARNSLYVNWGTMGTCRSLDFFAWETIKQWMVDQCAGDFFIHWQSNISWFWSIFLLNPVKTIKLVTKIMFSLKSFIQMCCSRVQKQNETV